MALDTPLRKAIIEFLVPLNQFQTTPGRQTLLLAAGLDAILPQITLSGPPQEFVVQLVQRLWQYGRLPDGTPALVRLLEELATQVGTDRQQLIREFCQQLRQQPLPAPRPRPKTRIGVTALALLAVLVSVLIGAILFNEKFLPGPAVSLRRAPLMVSDDDVLEVFGLKRESAEAGFLVLRPLEYLDNRFRAQDDVVVDAATALMWQHAGSPAPLPYAEARKYVAQLNHDRFAGYADWRLPTIPELMSLLEPEQQAQNLYIDPVFDATQRWCWSADTRPIAEDLWESVWCVDFDFGNVFWYDLRDFYVRGVRSLP